MLNMSVTWPWILMVIGTAVLFIHKLMRARRSFVSYRHGLGLRAPSRSKRDASSGGLFFKIIERSHDWMPVMISVLVLIGAMYVILSRNTYAESQQKWAFGIVGTIVGYWLKR